MYPFGGAKSVIPSATLLFPVATWAKENIIVNGWEVNGTGGSIAQIVAAEDDTEVTIIPTRNLQDGVGVTGVEAHQPTIPTRQRATSAVRQDEELTGSIVTSTKPTTIFGGIAARVPANGAPLAMS